MDSKPSSTLQIRPLVWKANGQKPNWLRELEAKGGKAVEVETGR